MIICLYHGSSMKKVNEEQTSQITSAISNKFSDKEVVACYYSKHVLAAMERRQTPIANYRQVLSDNYDKHEQIIILITNMMNGKEYESICKHVKTIDVCNKIKMTKPILSAENIHHFAQCLNNDYNTIFVGHGNHFDNKQYDQLDKLLVKNNNYVITLKDDFNQFIGQRVAPCNVTVKPLMITSAYHAKIDIEQKLVSQLEAAGFIVDADLAPLASNKQFHQLCINNLNRIIGE